MSTPAQWNLDEEAAESIAIIGMAGRFPGAADLAAFWENLAAGRDTITRFDAGSAGLRTQSAAEADFVAARGVLDDAAMFDAEYFGIAPREADRMDPQHRIFLETCSNALEDGGYDSHTFAGEIGLFAGCSLNTYLLANLAVDRGFLDELTGNYQVGEFQVALGNDKDFLTTRAAYKLNLRGPCVSVQSACATSLVAVCQASQALLNYQCDMALAGGVSVTFPQHRGHLYQEGGIGSKDGHCRPFDAQATGTVFGHGAGAVLLKRLSEAVRDGDQIHAVIRGFAVNNDGSAKAGYMAPGVDGQSRVILAAQAMAGISADTVTYVEAHGTATPLGDPIEIAALTRAFRASTDKAGFCDVGTAKGNVGHLDSAAGVTGLIKTVLQMQHRTICGLAHFERVNPEIDLRDSPFCFSGENRAWTADGPLRAGVSAFGVGGVNAHVVLEEAPQVNAAHSARSRPQVLCISGRTELAAARAAEQLADKLSVAPSTNLADAAFTLACGRHAHGVRLAVAAKDADEAIARLRAVARQAGTNRRGVKQLAWMFSGQGTQFAGMGGALYREEPVYREVVDACAAALAPMLGQHLHAALFSAAGDAGAEATLGQTEFAQPALFVTELALATLWQTWGLQPQAMVGHSLGEYVAATLAGVFTRAEAVQLVALRGRMMQATAPGAMLSVALGEQDLAQYVTNGGADLSVAAWNSPRASVLSGTFAEIAEVERKLEAAGIASRRLRTSHAFHSAMMDSMLAPFEAEVARLQPRKPVVRFVSSVTGTWITEQEATSPGYWARQCRLPVRFGDAVRCLLEEGYDGLLEIGPGDTLARLAMQQGGRAFASFVPARGTMEERTLQDCAAELWSAGAALDWTAYFAPETRRRVSLPTYPFERRLHWIEPPPAMSSAVSSAMSSEMSSAVSGAATPGPGVDLQQQEAIATPMMEPAALSAVSNDIPSPSREALLRVEIASVLTELSGIDTTPAEAECQFLELGFDSLFLTQATQALSKKFGLKLTFRQLMEQFSTIAALAGHLDRTLPAEAFRPQPMASQPVTRQAAALPPQARPAASSTGTGVDGLLATQLAALSQMFASQVEALRAAAAGVPAQPQQAMIQPQALTQPQALPQPQALSQPHALPRPAAPTATQAEAPADVRFSAQRAVQAKTAQELTPTQQSYIDTLVAHYQARTPGSKQKTQAGRPQLADPRAVAGFRPQWKEMVYPLIVERARGSRLWDVDGNEYIDIVNGYGCIMFGHSPEFVVQAAQEQLERGVAIGPQTPLAAEVAALICELTGNERVTFCNTGSEAVMAAIRVARTVTGRDRIVYFAGDYHGTFDEVLVRSTPRGSAPIAPGIPLANTTNVVVLEHGSEAALTYLRTHAEEIAAVLIEPVQTRHPELQPMEFIRAVRTLTETTGTAMILDEVVTGFRLAPGGVQEMLGIRADMCTYGKVIGGGHPIGVLSGKAMYLDALDGGAWSYGDSSGPEVGVTFFAGTFVRHPLALAAARAVLQHLKAAGPALQRELNAKTAQLAQSLDRFFVERGVPSRVHHFASWFYFTFPSDARLGSLLYYAMRARGIHIQESYPCFLTTAHTDADIAAIETAFRETIVEMQAAGVLPGSVSTAPAAAPDGSRLEAAAPAPAESARVSQPAPTGQAILHEDALPETPRRVHLTEPQQEIFLAAALNDEANCAFNETLTLELTGSISESRLLVALDSVFARHDALKSTLSEDGEWLRIGAAPRVETDFVDLRGFDEALQREALAAAVEHDAQTPFDLTRGPLLRSTCFRLAKDHAVLVLTAHHIVLDGWSANVLLEEIGALYSTGDPAQLAPLLPFSSYAVIEQKREQMGEFRENEEYWVARFAGRSPRLELPTDRPRGESKSYRGATLEGALGEATYSLLKQASARLGCSLYVTLLAGFEALLHRLTGQSEVVVGISTAGQALVGDASLVGHCVNFVPMLSLLQPGMTAREHAKLTKTALLDAYDHQEFTYGSLLRKLKLERIPGRMPLIEVQFNLERVSAKIHFDGLEAKVKACRKQFVNTDLFLNVVETGNDLKFMCDYNRDLMDEATVARWMQHWAELLRSAAETPDARVDELRLLGVAEREALVSGWNRTGHDFGPFRSVSERVLEWAEREPGRVALECGGVRWTYAELVGYARRLAARLLAEGLTPGALVGIAVDRSPEMVGAVLAVMLAGGAYVPLDARHPRERLEGVLADAGVTLLIASRALGLQSAAKVLLVGETLRSQPAEMPAAALTHDSLAYVIYTSGSTGRPKGVAVEHGALINLLAAMEQQPGLTLDDTLVAITTLAFDIAGLELLLPLITGARLVVATEAEVQDGRLLLDLLERAGRNAPGMTVLQATPGAWRLLLDAGLPAVSQSGSQSNSTLRLKALCGGEALPRELATRLLERTRELWNMYGPTETTIWSSATRVEPGTGPLRLGTPIANTTFHVLDERRQLLPAGVTGELFIGGEGLARGYWNNPGLTREKFVENPYGPGFLYATGDLARRHDDGSIELLGRRDFQVKIRGYRIELAEIEAAIMQHPAAKEAVVSAQRTDSGSPRLVAHIAVGVADRGWSDQIVEEVRKRLGEILPEYMIPAGILALPELPRNGNGKIDRNALPGITLEARESGATVFIEASTAAERTLAEIWSQVLEVARVGVSASIFDLGADSLAIFRIAARAQREGLAVTATQIFQRRTIAAIAREVEKETTSATVQLTTRIGAASREKYKFEKVKR